MINVAEFKPMFQELTRKVSTKLPSINIFIYGTWGVGKTTLGLSFPGTVYLVDLETGSGMYGDVFDNVKTTNPKSLKELINTITYLRSIVTENDAVVFDSESVYWDLLQYTRAEHANKGGIEGSGLNMGDWGTVKRVNNRFQNDLINLPCAVIALCQEKRLTNDEMVEDYIPSTEKSIPHCFDVVARMVMEDNRRILKIRKRRGNLLNKDEYDITGKTFMGVFGKDFDFSKIPEKTLMMDYRTQIMYARDTKQLKEVATSINSNEKISKKNKEALMDIIRIKVDKL